MDLFHVIYGDMGIDLGGFKGLMAQHLLDVSYRCPVSEHVSGASMSQGMGGDVLFDIGKADTAIDHLPDTVRIHLSTPSVQDKITGVFIIQEPRPDR